MKKSSVDPLKALTSIITKVKLRPMRELHAPVYQTVDYFACNELAAQASYHKIVDGACIASTIYHQCVRWAMDNKGGEGFKASASEAIAARVDGILRSLPATYDIILPLPESKIDHRARINKDIQIVRLSDEEAKGYEYFSSDLNSGNADVFWMALESGQTHSHLYSGQNILLIQDRGFADTSNERLLRYDPLYLLKIYLAASLIWGALRKGPTALEPALGSHDYEYYIYEHASKRYIRGSHHSSEDGKLSYEHSFTDDTATIEHVGELFGELIKKQRSGSTAKLQNSIQKSLYWYYEAQKSAYSHLKVVYLCTALDAFFGQYDSDVQKKQIIALEASETVGQQMLVLDEINKLQLRRNSIVHGEAAITYTLHSSQSTKEADRALTAGGEIFLSKFIGKKMERFINSVKSSH